MPSRPLPEGWTLLRSDKITTDQSMLTLSHVNDTLHMLNIFPMSAYLFDIQESSAIL